jgi:hypothetical protein
MGVMLRGFVPGSTPGWDQRDADEHPKDGAHACCIAMQSTLLWSKLTVFFCGRADKAVAAEDAENQPIDSDSRWNGPDSESAKFPFEFKSAISDGSARRFFVVCKKYSR